jgi:hypothetical protein
MGLCARKAANVVRIKCTETGRVWSEKELNTNILMQVRCYVSSLLCLLYGLSLGPSSLLRHPIPHAQTLLITADLFDSGYDSFLLLILVVFGL